MSTDYLRLFKDLVFTIREAKVWKTIRLRNFKTSKIYKEAFENPVIEEFPEVRESYLQQIKEPTSLKDIERKLLQREIRSVDDALHLFFLLIQNAKDFNEKTSPFYEAASKLKDFIYQQLYKKDKSLASRWNALFVNENLEDEKTTSLMEDETTTYNLRYTNRKRNRDNFEDNKSFYSQVNKRPKKLIEEPDTKTEEYPSNFPLYEGSTLGSSIQARSNNKNLSTSKERQKISHAKETPKIPTVKETSNFAKPKETRKCTLSIEIPTIAQPKEIRKSTLSKEIPTIELPKETRKSTLPKEIPTIELYKESSKSKLSKQNSTNALSKETKKSKLSKENSKFALQKETKKNSLSKEESNFSRPKSRSLEPIRNKLQELFEKQQSMTSSFNQSLNDIIKKMNELKENHEKEQEKFGKEVKDFSKNFLDNM